MAEQQHLAGQLRFRPLNGAGRIRGRLIILCCHSIRESGFPVRKGMRMVTYFYH